jgi:hypothetical protein
MGEQLAEVAAIYVNCSRVVRCSRLLAFCTKTLDNIKQVKGAKVELARFSLSDFSLEEIMSDEKRIDNLRSELLKGFAFKIPHEIDIQLLRDLRVHLLQIKNSNFANFVNREGDSPNHFRVHWNRKEQEVPADFFSWSFFPHNDDLFEIFKTFRLVFGLRNVLSGRDRDDFLSGPKDGYVARFAAQFYPSGRGFMAGHQDPLQSHQSAIPTILLSTPGLDFSDGGVWAQDSNGNKFMIDKELSFGDLFLFHPRIPHGVDLVDPGKKYSGISDSGRLMAIVAVNALDKAQGKANVSESKG